MIERIVHNEINGYVRRQYWVCLLLVITTLLVYLQVRNFEFIDYDDDLYVVKNHHVQTGLTQKSVIWAIKNTYAANWHPLTLLSHMLDVQLYGLNSGPHHLTNLIIHIVNTVLLFLILNKITGSLWRSAFVAALFALHPLHVESVAQVSCRKDVLSTFFWMLTILAYTGYVKRSGLLRYLLIMLFFTLGLTAKPMLVTLPFVLLLLDYWPFARFNVAGTDGTGNNTRHRKIFLHLIWEKIPLFIITAAFCVVTFIAQEKAGAVRSLITVPFSVRAANVLVSYIKYIIKMFWPAQLAVFYPHPGMWPLWQTLGAFLLLMLVSIVVVISVKKRPYLMVGWLWYIGTLIPVIGLVQVGSQAMADRYTYVPLIGLFIMIAWGVDDMLKQWRYKRFVLTTVALSVLSILMVVTWIQTSHWQNSIKLFGHAIEVTSDNLTAHNNLGIALEEEGRFEEAIRHYRIVLEKDPNHANAHNNLGNALLSQGRISAAKDHYADALRLDPKHAAAHSNLANILARQGKTAEAVQHYLKALKIIPDYKEAYFNLGNMWMGSGKFEDAADQYRKALEIDPFYAAAHNNLAVILVKQGKTAEAVRYFSEILKIHPENMALKNNLKVILNNRRKIDAAVDKLQIVLDPDRQGAEKH